MGLRALGLAALPGLLLAALSLQAGQGDPLREMVCERAWRPVGPLRAWGPRVEEAVAAKLPEYLLTLSQEDGQYNMGFCGTGWVGTNGRIVLFNNCANLSVALASDLAHPVRWDIPIPGHVYKGQFDGDRAYLLTTSPYGYGDGLETWDLSDPANPVRLSRFRDYGGLTAFRDFSVGGGYAYMAGLENGLVVFNLAGMSTMGPMNTFPAPEGQRLLERVLLAGDTLMAYGSSSADATIAVYDVHVPGEPVLLGSKRSPALVGISRWFYLAPYLVAVYGAPQNPGGGFSAGTQVGLFYWPDPANVESLTLNPANAAAPFVAGSAIHEAALDGTRLFLATDSGATVVDLANPAIPTLAATFDDTRYHGYSASYGIAAAAGVYVIGDRTGVTRFDLAGERTGYVISCFELMGGWGYYKPFSLSRDCSIGLLNSEFDGTSVCSFGSGAPVRVGFWENTIGGSEGHVLDSQISPDGLFGYLATLDASDHPESRGALVTLDLNDPAAPTAIGSYTIPASQGEWFPTDLNWIGPGRLSATLAEAQTGAYRVDLLDLSDPEKPKLLGTYSPSPGTEIMAATPIPGTFMGHTYLALACGWTPSETARVQVIDVTDPGSPFMTADLDTGYYGFSTDLTGVQGETGTYIIVAALTSVVSIHVDAPSSASGLEVSCGGTMSEEPYQIVTPDPWATPGPHIILGAGSADLNVGGDAQVFQLMDKGCLLKTENVHRVWWFPWYAAGYPADGEGRIFEEEMVSGVLTYRPGMDSECPFIEGGISPQPPMAITAPVTFTVDGIQAPHGIKEVRFFIESGRISYLGGLAQPSAGNSYSFTFDPATAPWQGLYDIRVEAEDTMGLVASADFGSYDLVRYPPLAVSGDASPASGPYPLTVTLSADASGGAPPYAFRWDFSNGGWMFGPTVTRTFSSPGTYGWTLTVGDGVEYTAQAYGDIEVLDPRIYPSIDSVQRSSSPFRLKLAGGGFQPGCEILVNGVPVPTSQFVSDTQLIAKKGQPLKSMFPKGLTVAITVRNPDGAESQAFSFIR